MSHATGLARAAISFQQPDAEADDVAVRGSGIDAAVGHAPRDRGNGVPGADAVAVPRARQVLSRFGTDED